MSQPAAKRGSGAGAKVKKMAEKAKEAVVGGEFPLLLRLAPFVPLVAPAVTDSLRFRDQSYHYSTDASVYKYSALSPSTILRLGDASSPNPYGFDRVLIGYIAAPSGPHDSSGPATADEPMVTSSTGAIPETTTTPADATGDIGAPATSTAAADSAAVTSAEADTGVASPLVAQNGTATSKLSKDSVGTTISLEGFGGKVTRHDGVEVTIKELVEGSGSGVVVFTFPKASTPGCKCQPCFIGPCFACEEGGHR